MEIIDRLNRETQIKILKLSKEKVVEIQNTEAIKAYKTNIDIDLNKKGKNFDKEA
jgi:hypothetical protein